LQLLKTMSSKVDPGLIPGKLDWVLRCLPFGGWIV